MTIRKGDYIVLDENVFNRMGFKNRINKFLVQKGVNKLNGVVHFYGHGINCVCAWQIAEVMKSK